MWTIRPTESLILDPIMQTAFPFPAKMAELGWIGNLVESLGGHPIPDGDVALGPKRVVGEGVGLEVFAEIAVRPIEQGEKFEAGVLASKEVHFLA